MKRLTTLILLTALMAGCAGAKTSGEPASAPVAPPAPAPAPAATAPAPTPPDPVTPPQPPAPPAPAPEDLLSEGIQRTLKLDELRVRLEAYLNAPGAAPGRERLSTMLSKWGVVGRDDGRIATIPMAEADLDGDGTAELITVLNVWGEWKSVPTASAFVISRQGDGYRVDRSPTPPEAYVDGAALLGARDLTGDGRPEIVWVARDHGAHTSSARVLVSHWKPGSIENLLGDMVTTFAKVALDGKDLVLAGGTIGSAGAGLTQRAATLRYRWNGKTFALADRRFDASEWGYHRLIDGINAETFGRTDEAEAFYRSALEPGRPALPADNLPPEWPERFGQATTELARFRLGLLLMQRGGGGVPEATAGPYGGLTKTLAGAATAESACKAAIAWGGANPEFFAALNAPYGYANYRWSWAYLCGTLPPDTN